MRCRFHSSSFDLGKSFYCASSYFWSRFSPGRAPSDGRQKICEQLSVQSSVVERQLSSQSIVTEWRNPHQINWIAIMYRASPSWDAPIQLVVDQVDISGDIGKLTSVVDGVDDFSIQARTLLPLRPGLHRVCRTAGTGNLLGSSVHRKRFL